MPVVRVIVREGQEKLYHEAQASIHTPDRTLRITRNQDSIAEFQSEYYQYWEYVEETSAGTGEDTHTDTSVSGAVGKRAEPSASLGAPACTAVAGTARQARCRPCAPIPCAAGSTPYAPSGVGAMACAGDGGRFKSSCGNAVTSSSMIACIETRAVGRRCSSTTGTCR